MLEAPQFSWVDDPDNEVIVITQESAPLRDIIFELTRQAIGLARRQSRLPYEQGLPEDSELIPLLAHLWFPEGYEFEVLNNRPPYFTDRLVDIDYYGVPIKFSLGASTQDYVHDTEPLKLSQRQFDGEHGNGASLTILRLAMIALDVRNLNALNS